MSRVLTEATAEQQNTDKTVLGFWIYIMTDCVLFASLFATYAVLRNNTFGGAAGKDLFDLPYVLVETLLLLMSSFTCGLAVLAAHRRDVAKVKQWFAITAILGLLFLGMEIIEFHHLIAEGNSWRRSGFLSAYFTLVGTHGLHITAGLLWMFVMLRKITKDGLIASHVRRITLLSLFWHFLDIIWIFIFSIVYLFGALAI